MNPRTRAIPSLLLFAVFAAAGPLTAQAPVVETLASLAGGSGGVTVTPDGRILVADFGEMLGGGGAPGTRVFEVAPDGATRIFADGLRGASGNEMGSDGVFYQSNIAGGYISKIQPDGTHESWVSEGIQAPVGLVFDHDGDLLVANCGSGSIQRVRPDGTSTRFAEGDLFRCPNGITIDDAGVMYVANFYNGDVVKVLPDGTASVLATIPGNNNGHLTFHDGALYVVARAAHQIYRVDLEGSIELIAGTGDQGLDDGPALEATFNFPNDIGFSPDGRYIYVNDVADLSTTGQLLAPMVVRRIDLRP